MAKKQKRPRKNPAFDRMAEMLGNTAGNLLVSSALQGATLEEKMLICSLIPTFLKFIRSTPAIGVDKLLDKMYPEGVTFDLPGLGELQRPASVKPPEGIEPAGGKKG
jgi:hypothetical protein